MKRAKAGSWVMACVAFCLSGVAGLGQGSPAPRWPDGFNANAGGDTEWREHVVDSPLVSTRLALPPDWTVSRGPAVGDLTALHVKSGWRVELAEAKPGGFNYTEPVSAERLKGSIATMQSSVPSGYIVEQAGQIRAGQHWWLWHQSLIPSFERSVRPEYQEMVRAVGYGSGRTWSFVATPHSQLVRIYFSVLYPPGASGAEIAARNGKGGSIFARIVQRVTFRAR